MELDGRSVTHATCPIIWGDVGPNAQHAFYQLLHQGGHTVSADFIAVAGREVAAPESVRDALVAQENIQGGVRYLDWLMGEFDGDPILVLAGYNAGEGSVRSHQGVPPFAETRDYVPRVLAAFQVAKGLCKTPPQLISDGCVFRMMH